MARPKQRSMLIGAAVMTMTAASIGMATAAHAATCDTTFNATAANGNWFDAANWSNGVPTATSNACIPDTGPAEVTIATGANAAAKTLDAGRPIRVSSGSLRLGGGPADVSTLRQPLILTGGVFGGTGIVNVAPNGADLIAFDWQGGRLEDAGLLNVTARNGSRAFRVAGLDDHTWSAHAIHSSGNGILARSVLVSDNPVFRVLSGEVKTYAGLYTLNHARQTGLFSIAGTLLKVGAGTARFDTAVVASGLVDVQSGRLLIDHTLQNFDPTTKRLTGGSFLVGADATLAFAGADVVHLDADLDLADATSAMEDEAGHDALANLATMDGVLSLRGGKRLRVAGDFDNFGIVVIGPTSQLIVPGDLRNGPVSDPGRFIFELGPGPTNGRVTVGGLAYLDCFFSMDAGNAAFPVGTSFTVMTFASHSGSPLVPSYGIPFGANQYLIPHVGSQGLRMIVSY